MKDSLQDEVLDWYRRNGRQFSWREENRSLYEMLVAEVFLQKTRAETVEEVYEKFLQEFPTIEKLASSEPGEIKSYLSKLGLQERRTKWLKAIAERIVGEFGGEVPKEEDEIKDLPGVGLYIGNAILCFGFGKRVPILDANTSRVIGRVQSLDYDGDLRRNEGLKKGALEMLPKERIKEFNWALLDIGALLCDRKFPECIECPLKKDCNFYSHDNVIIVPVSDYSFSKVKEDGFYACPKSPRLENKEYIAFYQTKPTSAITHLGKVGEVEIKKESDFEYKLMTFGDKVEKEARVFHIDGLKQIDKIPYDGKRGIQGKQYTSLKRLNEASDVTQI